MIAARHIRSACAALVLSAALVVGPARAADFVAVQSPRPVDTVRIEIGHPDATKTSLEAVLPQGPAIVHFWAMWRVPCRAELPKLAAYRETLAAEGKADRLAVVALEKGDYSRIRTFLEDRLGLAGLPSLQNGDGRAGPAFGLFGLPATALIDGERRIVALARGPLDWDDALVRAKLTRHLAGQEWDERE